MLMVRPGRHLAPALAVCAAVAAGAAWWTPLAAIGAGAAVAVLLLAAVEAHWLRRVRVMVERPALIATGLGRDTPVRAEVWHDAAVDLRIAVRWPWPAAAGGGDWQGAVHCRPGRRSALDANLRGTARGRCEGGPAWTATTRFGLAERLARSGDGVRIEIGPDLESVRRLRRRYEALFLRGFGQRIAPRRGQGREPDHMRNYVPGDDWRHLAWKASAKRGQLTVRTFRLERSQDVVLCVDAGHRMAAAVSGAAGAASRIDHAVDAAVLAAWMCDRCEDRVGLVPFAAAPATGLGQGRGPAHLARLTRTAGALAADWLHTDYLALASHLRRRLRSRSLVLIFTVLPERGDHGDLLTAARLLLPRHLPLFLAIRDPALEAEADAAPEDHRGLCRTLAAADVVDERRQLISELRHLGCLVAESAPGDAGTVAVDAYLEAKRRQLL